MPRLSWRSYQFLRYLSSFWHEPVGVPFKCGPGVQQQKCYRKRKSAQSGSAMLLGSANNYPALVSTTQAFGIFLAVLGGLDHWIVHPAWPPLVLFALFSLFLVFFFVLFTSLQMANGITLRLNHPMGEKFT